MATRIQKRKQQDQRRERTEKKAKALADELEDRGVVSVNRGGGLTMRFLLGEKEEKKEEKEVKEEVKAEVKEEKKIERKVGFSLIDEWKRLPDSAYNTNPKFPKQVKHWNWSCRPWQYGYTSEKGKVRNITVRFVPPWNRDWPFDHFGMDKRYKAHTFLERLLENKTCIEIMRTELLIESNNTYLLRKVPSKERKEYVHFAKNWLWQSWSAWLQLKWSMWHEKDEKDWEEAGMYECTSFFVCLINNFMGDLDFVYMGLEKYSDDQMLRHIESFARNLYKLMTLVIDERVLNKNPHTDKGIIDSNFKFELRQSDWFKKKYKGKDAQGAFLRNLGTVFPYLPQGQEIRRRQNSAFTALRMMEPINIPEVELWKAVENVARICWGYEDGTWRYQWGAVKITTPEQCMAALTMCQLGTGSRARGVIGVNTVEPTNFKLAEDELGDDPNTLPTVFATSAENLITVRRITKTKKIELQALISYQRLHPEADLRKKEGLQSAADLFSDFDKDQMDIIKSRLREKVITKPLLSPFFLPTNYGFKKTLTAIDEKTETPLTPRDVFLDLYREMRLFVEANSESVIWETVEGTHHRTVIDYEQEKYENQKKYITKMVGEWTGKMNRFIKKEMEGVAVATHDLRRLYVAYGFELYAKGRMKEVGWAGRVLAHESYEVSLLYTMMNITLGVVGKGKTLEQDVLSKLNLMAEKFHQLEELQERLRMLETGEGAVVVSGPDGSKVVPKLPRAKRGTTEEEYKQRGLDAVKILLDHDLPVTFTRLVEVGVRKVDAPMVVEEYKKNVRME